jgi:hypothetical protein
LISSVVLGLDLVALQPGELVEAHFQDGVGLDSREARSLAISWVASSRLLEARMIFTTSSRWSSALSRPSRMWARASALARSNLVRRVMTSKRWQEALQQLAQVHHLGAVLVDRQHGRAEGVLELGLL